MALLIPIAAAAAPADEHVGSWILRCRDEGCFLRHREPLQETAGLSAGVEIYASEKTVVPAVVVRGVPGDPLLAAAFASRVKATLQIGASVPAALICHAAADGYVCTPALEAASDLAAALPSARSATVRVSVAVNDADPMTSRGKTIGLAGTKEALARLRASGLMPLPATASRIPPGWAVLVDKGMKAAGYPDGASDLSGFLTKYLGR